MKRFLSLLIALSMLLSIVPVTAFASSDSKSILVNPFDDVKDGDWFYDAVQYARINGFFRGTTDTTFDPSGTMTRGMFITVLGRMAGVDTTQYNGEMHPFADIKSDMYYAPYVAWAVKYNIAQGTGDSNFSPDALITREQMATFFVRYLDRFGVKCDTDKKINTYPADIDSVTGYAKSAVLKLWEKGLLSGDGVSFNPTANATRAETATLATRFDEVVETWYKEYGIPSTRVRIDPKTGSPIEKKKETTSTITPIYIPSTPSTPSIPETKTYSVKFYDGDRLIDTIKVAKDEVLDTLPKSEKVSKADGVFEGWYANADFTEPFDATAPITSNTNVYAKYTELASTELNITSFAQMDVKEDVLFTVKGDGDINAIKLVPK
ncbi:MAG: S-layer homology domain-containing protein, partial [Clostridia bacterium]|nr:S-layer homology domain-containing protein [Clostridia bacterium]